MLMFWEDCPEKRAQKYRWLLAAAGRGLHAADKCMQNKSTVRGQNIPPFFTAAPRQLVHIKQTGWFVHHRWWFHDTKCSIPYLEEHNQNKQKIQLNDFRKPCWGPGDSVASLHSRWICALSSYNHGKGADKGQQGQQSVLRSSLTTKVPTFIGVLDTVNTFVLFCLHLTANPEVMSLVPQTCFLWIQHKFKIKTTKIK